MVADFGANYGIIISKKGFQKGAYEAAKNTNILLFNWIEFQEYFQNTWVVHMQFAVSQVTKPLLNYVSAGALVFFRNEINNLSDRIKFDYFCQMYFNVAFYSMDRDYKNIGTNRFDFNNFQEILTNAKKDFERDFRSYEEYYLFLVEMADEGIKEFDKLFNAQLRQID